jgi:hypothetical protein
MGGDEPEIGDPMMGLHNSPKPNKGVGLVATTKN